MCLNIGLRWAGVPRPALRGHRRRGRGGGGGAAARADLRDRDAASEEKAAADAARATAEEQAKKPKPGELVKLPCNKKKTWRQQGTLPKRLPRNMSSLHILKDCIGF